MTTKKQLLHSAKITNNCPECFSIEGLEFSFLQEEKENKLYSKANPIIEEILYCHHCNHTIYPVNWTQDIERVYAYHKKLAKPKNPSFKLKPLAFIIILADIIALGVLIYFFTR
ncbi:MAG: hypothetical protein R2786_10550 [Flavobacteriaceae bacterium]